MVEITYQMVLSTIQTVGILVGIIYYLTIMRNTSKARQRELIAQRSQRISSKEYMRTLFRLSTYTDWETLEEYQDKYGRWTNPEAAVDFTYIVSIYDNLGFLYKNENVDPEFLFNLYPVNAIIRVWEHFEPVIQDIRARNRNPDQWKHLEYLYHEARKRYPEVTDWHVDRYGLEYLNKQS